MQQVELKAQMRRDAGRTGVKKLRRKGWVPAVLYGPRVQPLSLQVEEKALRLIAQRAAGANLFVELEIAENGKTARRLALLQELQQHPTTDQILHADFREISMTEKLTATVAVEPVGEAAGVKEGGVLNRVLYELTVRCLPKDLPERIMVDVSKLAIGQSLQIADITAPAGVEILAADKTTAVFAVVAPMAEEEAAPAAEAAAEPEVIREKKEEGEEASTGAEEKKPAKGEAKGEKKTEPVKAEIKPAAGKADAKTAAGRSEEKPKK